MTSAAGGLILRLPAWHAQARKLRACHSVYRGKALLALQARSLETAYERLGEAPKTYVFPCAQITFTRVQA